MKQILPVLLVLMTTVAGAQVRGYIHETSKFDSVDYYETPRLFGMVEGNSRQAASFFITTAKVNDTLEFDLSVYIADNAKPLTIAEAPAFFGFEESRAYLMPLMFRGDGSESPGLWLHSATYRLDFHALKRVIESETPYIMVKTNQGSVKLAIHSGSIEMSRKYLSDIEPLVNQLFGVAGLPQTPASLPVVNPDDEQSISDAQSSMPVYELTFHPKMRYVEYTSPDLFEHRASDSGREMELKIISEVSSDGLEQYMIFSVFDSNRQLMIKRYDAVITVDGQKAIELELDDLTNDDKEDGEWYSASVYRVSHDTLSEIFVSDDIAFSIRTLPALEPIRLHQPDIEIARKYLGDINDVIDQIGID